MNPLRPSFAAVLAAALSIASASAQADAGLPSLQPIDRPAGTSVDRTAHLARDLFVPLHEERCAATGRDRLWAGGDEWKAAFHDGFVFLPRPGGEHADAPWRWRTEHVSAGGARVLLASSAPRRVHERRCEYDLGAVVEAYDVGPEGVEQTFVLPSSPGPGDVEIVGRVDSPLRCEPRVGAHAPLQFVSPCGGPGVVYGAATAIDADGRRLALDSASDGERITLRVPGAWLADARFPVVVDPLLTPVVVHTLSDLVTAIDLDRDDRNNQLGVAFARIWSNSDHDVYFRLATDSFGAPVTVFSRIGGEDTRAPSLAYVNGANRWIVAYEVTAGTSDIEVHVHTGGSSTLSSTFAPLPSPLGGLQRRPAVGGVRTAAAGQRGIIVRECHTTWGGTDPTQIWATVYDPVLRQAMATVHVLGGGSGSSAASAQRPSVSKDAHGGSWVIAAQHIGGLIAPRWSVFVRRIDGNGGLAGTAFGVDRNGVEHCLAPRVDGRGGRYLVTFGTEPVVANQPAPADVVCSGLRAQRFDWSESGAAATDARASVALVQSSAAIHRPLGLAFDANRASFWLFTYGSQTLLGRAISMVVLGHDGQRRTFDVLGTTIDGPAAVVYDDDNDRFATSYRDDVLAGDSRVMGRLWTYPSLPLPDAYGTGCHPGLLFASNRSHAGQQGCWLQLLQGPPSQFAFLLLSLDDTDVPLDPYGLPGCRLLVDPAANTWLGALLLPTDAFGTAVHTFDLPAAAAGMDLYAQWALLDASRPAGLATTSGIHVAVR